MNAKRMGMVFGLLLLWFGQCCWAAAGGPSQDGTKKLVLHPLSPKGSGSENRFLPGPQEMTEGDAFPLYVNAVESLPKDLDWAKIKSWRELPLKDLPQGEVAAVLRSYDVCLPLLEQAGRCKRCNWAINSAGNSAIDLQSLRNVAFLTALKVRSQLACGDYAACVQNLGMAFSLARHLSEGPTLVYTLVGAAIIGVTCGEMELYVQQGDAPSLEAALRSLPQPFMDEEPSELYGMKEADRVRPRQVLRRANRHLIAMQYIEALRGYAGKAGQWPETLDEIKPALPNDPVTDKPFEYRRITKTQATLAGPMPEGGSAKDIMRHELNLQPKER
ncbi:MAG TPA: hypothetical protein PKH24_01425 [Sedimentisphaerales bacterium]|jgi:hypothetical protein|nr:hypothetical protein [Sedimentisphaerales bacterium]HNU28136.1 hypothetical protein [Sedimentisphaerales bacterium]